MNYLKTYLSTHLFYVVLIAVGLICGRVWLSEHDARVQAEQTVKAQQAQVKDLQSQINMVQAQADKDVAAIRAKVIVVKTPAQAIAALPDVSSLPLNSRPAPDGGVTVDAVPLFQELAQCKIDAVQLSACTTESKAKDQIIADQVTEIKALKKKPAFFVRLKHVAEAVGVGIGVGLFLGGHL